jgi:aquaporin Z
MYKELIAEFLGTMFLILAVVKTGNGFEIGTTLAVIIFLFNKTSGANFNPAVTVAKTLIGKQKPHMLIPYVIMQLLGVGAALIISKHV